MNKTWRASGSVRRYGYAFGMGFLLGSALYILGHNFRYTVDYERNYMHELHTTRPPFWIRPYTGTSGPWLTPAPTPRLPDTQVPTLVSGIPKIIHQTWENDSIPAQFSQWVQSWEKNQKDWSHLFWTSPGAKLLISKSFPLQGALYKSYPTKLQKADARRYFIMYHYGGVSVDLDMESLKPLDELLNRYSCIIAQEPRAHRALLYENFPRMPMPGFMACKPKHPFFKLTIDLLADYAKDFRYDAPRSTGPRFLMDALDIYMKTKNQNDDEIHVAPSEWFLPTYDPMQTQAFNITCTELYEKLPSYKREVCDELKARNFRNEATVFAFTDHHWVHTASSSFRSKGTVTVESILNTVQVV